MDPAKMKVLDLRSELGALGLDTKGNKPALVERLKKALEAKSGKNLPDTSILDTSTEDADEPPTPCKPAPRTTRRTSSSRLAATPIIENGVKTEDNAEEAVEVKTEPAEADDSTADSENKEETSEVPEVTEDQVMLGAKLDKRIKFVIRSSLPPPPPPNQAFETTRAPGGSIRITEPVTIARTPRGSVKRKRVVEESIHFTSVERTAACGMDQEEDEAALEDPEQMEHVRKWVCELPSPGTSGCIPPSSSVPDPVPSTSGTTVPMHTRIRETEGSEFDSDFDDEFDVDELIASGGMTRNIPDDDELDDRVRKIVQSVESAMDEAVDNLVGTSTVFHWQANFDSFGGVPETFSGPTPGAIKDYDTPYEAFTDIWSRDIMELICKETNRYAKQVVDAETAAGTLKASSRLHRWVDTDVDELYLLFAIYIFMGIDPRTSQHEYWKVNSYLEMPKFRQLMTYNRFILLSKFLHFTDNSDVSQDLPLSGGIQLSAKLRKLAPVISHLNSKFECLYNLNQDIAIDESLTLYKGRLSWAQAIRSKAARFGIKSFELCESKTGYMYRFDIYTGKNSERSNVALSVDLAGKSTQVVLDLLKGLDRRGHCVTMDNYYNCPSLARYLKTLGFDCLGTLRPNREHVPEEIAKVPKNVAKGTIVSRHSGDVSCIAWKDSKVVTMISTYHTDETYVSRKAGRELVKPVVVRDYNNTMGGVDLKDQKLSMYLLERKRCLKWYMKMFKRLLNVSVHNALILLLSSLGRRNMALLTHRKFREQLASALVTAHRRPSREIVVPVAENTRLRSDIIHAPKYLASNKRMRCHICLRNGTRKMVRLKCETCDEAMCFGDCWKVWHTAQQLPGKIIHVRKGRRN
ncbi:piggyBac transposable element-derived protein 4-like isoform X1 [Colias croceus]|uniref:piggyBac transposable element-derived protein 4-like isoform X1 n=1 Tax=Colias crocea TaxID=72248 RepID=UPI001E27EEA3|nr:piggyBac transposable element-derived protein 4-like isoform X1 [Colias croceus]XP_045508005.1 piggyBac transposable element-derived protein 4-like isoform X1 [Colias croceus]